MGLFSINQIEVDMLEINNEKWRCFLMLEKDFITIQEYVEFNTNNYKSYSIKFRSIISQACSEIDIIFKLICGFPLDERKELDDYFGYFQMNHQEFITTEISLPLYNINNISPWLDWKKGVPPSFWTANNKLKHQGTLEQANLKNSLFSLAALFTLLLAYYLKTNGENFSKNWIIQAPSLFSYPGFGNPILTVSNPNNFVIPGFAHTATQQAIA